MCVTFRDGAMEEVTAREKEKRGLLQLRNEIVQHLTAKPTPQLGDQVLYYTVLCCVVVILHLLSVFLK